MVYFQRVNVVMNCPLLLLSLSLLSVAVHLETSYPTDICSYIPHRNIGKLSHCDQYSQFGSHVFLILSVAGTLFAIFQTTCIHKMCVKIICMPMSYYPTVAYILKLLSIFDFFSYLSQ